MKMKQCPKVLETMKVGDIIRIFSQRDESDCGVWAIASLTETRDGEIRIGLVHPMDEKQTGFTTSFTAFIEFAKCNHNWKRLDLFRTTEFHCAKCSAVRPFDKEKDEAA